MVTMWLSLCLAVTAVCVGPAVGAPTVSTPWGQIAGYDKRSPQGATFSAYQGIPFALPPTGQRRFAKPQPHPGVQGRVFNASIPTFICPQLEAPGQAEYASEDCLTLNVYAPVGTTGSNSVMIFIHGGGFTAGTALGYTPSELVTENNVIVVVIQYRLGIFGFLSSGDDAARGNYGLFDQQMAIQWVKDNIRGFGGDPDSITLFGESAGAASIGYQMLSPYSRGLFKRVLLQSGSPLASWAQNKNPASSFLRLANATGCLGTQTWSDRLYDMVGGSRLNTHQRALDCLRQQDSATLIRKFSVLPVTEGDFFMDPWVPTVDGAFVPRDPDDLVNDASYLRANGVTSLDVMLGVNNEEGSVLLANPEQSLEYLKQLLGETVALDGDLLEMVIAQEFRYFVPELQEGSNRLKTLVDVAKFFYTDSIGDGPVDVKSMSDAVGDLYIVLPTIFFARALAKAQQDTDPATRGSTYVYLFDHYPAGKPADSVLRGIGHAEDLSYQFDPQPPYLVRSTFTNDDYTIATTFRAMTTNFAKTGRPQLVLQQPSEQTWPQYVVDEEKYLSLQATPRVDAFLLKRRVAFWSELTMSLINSTSPEPGNWCWQRQQSGGGYVNQQPLQSYYFKGRINFVKLNQG